MDYLYVNVKGKVRIYTGRVAIIKKDAVKYRGVFWINALPTSKRMLCACDESTVRYNNLWMHARNDEKALEIFSKYESDRARICLDEYTEHLLISNNIKYTTPKLMDLEEKISGRPSTRTRNTGSRRSKA